MEKFRISAEGKYTGTFNLCHNLEWHDDERTVMEYEADSLEDAVITMKSCLDDYFMSYTILRMSDDGDVIDWVSFSAEEIINLGRYEQTSSKSNNWDLDIRFDGFFLVKEVTNYDNGSITTKGKCFGIFTDAEGLKEFRSASFTEDKESIGNNAWSLSLQFSL